MRQSTYVGIVVLFLSAGCGSATATSLPTAPPTLSAAEINTLGVQLCQAVEDGELAKVQRLIDGEAGVDAVCNEGVLSGATPLILAARGEHVDILQALIDAGADLDHQTESGVTALFAATVRDEVDKVRALLEAGADPNVNPDQLPPPFLVAAGNGQVAIVRLLLDAGVDPHTVAASDNATNVTALMKAAQSGDAATVQVLVDAGIDVNVQDNHGDHALNWNLFFAPDLEVTRLLLDAGSDPNIVGYRGRTALDWALAHGDEEIVILLRDADALTSSEVSDS